MASVAVLGLGNWGTAIARLWLLEGHKVKGWTIEQEVYESITLRDVNEKYLPHHPVPGLDVTMRLDEALEGTEIVVLAVPSSVILDVVEDVIPHLQPRHVLLDLAKGLAPGKRLISEAIHTRLKEENKTNPLAVLTGPTIAPEAAGGVMTTALVASEDQAIAQRLAQTLSTTSFILHPASDPVGADSGERTKMSSLLPADWSTDSNKLVTLVETTSRLLFSCRVSKKGASCLPNWAPGPRLPLVQQDSVTCT